MSRTNKYFRTGLDLLFVGTIGVLLILLCYISRIPRVLHSVLPGTVESATDEVAFDSGNILALNIVDTVSESLTGEVSVPQGPAATDPAGVDTMQESLAEREQSQELEALIERTEAYCVKCREKREMQNARRIVTKNGRNAMEGTCPICSTRLFRFIAR